MSELSQVSISNSSENSTPSEESFINIVKELYELRKIPQFIFFDKISSGATFKIRVEIAIFKTQHPDIEEVDFIICSNGGLADEAYKMIKALKTNFKIVNFIVPYKAKSAATLMSLGADKIIFDEYGELGPLDVQVGERKSDGKVRYESALIDEGSLKLIEERYSDQYIYLMAAHSYGVIGVDREKLSEQLLNYLSRFYEPLISKINPYQLGQKKRSLDIGKQYAERIVAQFHKDLDSQKRRGLIEFLVSGCPDHSYNVDYLLLKEYLENIVFQYEEFGDSYKFTLTRLSLELMSISENDSLSDISLVKFVTEQKIDNKKEIDDNKVAKTNKK